MTDTAAETRTVIVEREFAHPPAKVWRALTQPHLVAEWLMAGDVASTPGHRFRSCAARGPVAYQVLAVDPARQSATGWDDTGVRGTLTENIHLTQPGPPHLSK